MTTKLRQQRMAQLKWRLTILLAVVLWTFVFILLLVGGTNSPLSLDSSAAQASYAAQVPLATM